MNNAINFDEIKQQLVETGHCYQQDIDAATQQVISIEGEWNRDGSATITKTRAGWLVGNFIRTMPTSIQLPSVSNFDDAALKSAIESQFPGVMVKVNIL